MLVKRSTHSLSRFLLRATPLVRILSADVSLRALLTWQSLCVVAARHSMAQGNSRMGVLLVSLAVVLFLAGVCTAEVEMFSSFGKFGKGNGIIFKDRETNLLENFEGPGYVSFLQFTADFPGYREVGSLSSLSVPPCFSRSLFVS